MSPVFVPAGDLDVPAGFSKTGDTLLRVDLINSLTQIEILVNRSLEEINEGSADLNLYLPALKRLSLYIQEMSHIIHPND